jgi:GAF domain-containing protein
LQESDSLKPRSKVGFFPIALLVLMLISTAFLILIQNVDQFSDYFGGTMLKIATDAALVVFFALFAGYIFLRAAQYRKRLEAMLDKLQRSNSLLQVLNEIQTSANADMDSDRILHEVLDSVMPLTSSIGTIYLLDENASKLRARASYGIDVDLDRIPEYNLGEGIAGKAAAEMEIVESQAAGQGQEKGGEAPAKMARIAIPITAGGKVRGVLMAATEKGSYSEEERTLLNAVSEVLGNALVNAKLYDITRRALDNSKRTQGYLESFILEAKIGVLVIDSKGMVLIANREAERYLNVQARDILGKDAFTMLDTSERRGSLLVQSFQSCFGDKLGAQYNDNMSDNHELIPVTVNVFPLFGGNQELIGAAATIIKA